MKVIILAGGKGTRISSVAKDIPKPMISICGKPVLERELINLRNQGFKDFIITIGYLGNIIKEYFGNGEKFGINIRYFEEEIPLGTGGALTYLKDELTEDFFVINGDSIMDVDLNRMLNYHKNKKADVTLLTHPNEHPYDSALIIADKKTGRVSKWLNKEEQRNIYKNRVNAGIQIINPKVIKDLEIGKMDLDRDLLKPIIKKGNVYSYDSSEYIKDMGTPERYKKVIDDVKNGIVSLKNLRNKQKAIFLDRDGTLNVYKGFITNYNDIELIEGVAKAIKKINEMGYLAIVITNQPVIARGDCTLEELEKINNKLETELGLAGAYLDDIFFCPHHPDKGFSGERPEYKIQCNCRKPNNGLILQAKEKYNIDLSESYMVGDSFVDIELGEKVGCKSVYVGNDDIDVDCLKFNSLFEFVCNELGKFDKI
ncbi:D,D-heptose 1,7-bisphosphate phosphatase [Lachnospiraceae bacterium RM5]|nr:D,D-heptose 1,7-bisphosphate phosphatase [Lachnospiraceae bacterium RM5]